MRAGSLFSGYAGLDMAVAAVFDAEPAWCSEVDPRPASVLAHRFPDVPNLGDITAINWAMVEPVDVICGGFPCQDISNAGQRAGIGGKRSGLWSIMADAIGVLRPRYVVIENVAALAVRGLDRVLADLASLGFDAEWASVRASEVGAPHGRERLFIVAWNAADERRDQEQSAERCGESAGKTRGSGSHDAYACRERLEGARAGRNGSALSEPVGDLGITTDSAGDGSRGQHACAWSSASCGGGERNAGGDDRVHVAPYSECGFGPRHRDAIADYGTAANGPREALPRRCRSAVADSDSLIVSRRAGDRTAIGWQPESSIQWGKYGPAIKRWESVLDRPSPAPWQLSERTGNRQLSARFTEWLMGLPDGWVTDVPGMTRNAALHVLGNGVVPQPAEYALRLLLDRVVERVA